MDEPGTALDGYERRIGRWSRRIAGQFLDWLDQTANRRWLDVGAGTGALSAAVSASCAPTLMVELDRSPADLHYGREHGLHGAAVPVAASAFALPFPCASFDVVVSALLLNQFDNPARAVAEMLRVLRPGGTIAAYVWDFAGEMQPLRRFWDAAIALDPGATAYDQGVKFPLCRLDRMVTLFEETGLQGVQARPLDAVAEFRHFDELWEPLVAGNGSVVDYALSLPPDRLHALRDRLRQNMPPALDGAIRLKVRALAVRGHIPAR